MPTYDVECSSCSLQDSQSIKLADLAAWDESSICPSCKATGGVFKRVILRAPAGRSGEKAAARLETSRKETLKANFIGSGEKDAMRHKQAKNFNADQAGALRESVAKGEYEGF